jgi:hypothetical protein
MQATTRIQDDAGLANRYLAGQLSASELETYERYLIDHPDAVQELEATARLKAGLAHLRDAGQIDVMLRRPSSAARSRTTMLAFAASVALIAIAVGLWRSAGLPDQGATLVATATQLIDGAGRPLVPGSSYALLRTRSSTYDALIELPPEPRAIELRVRPEAAASFYSVALSQIRVDGSIPQIGNVTNLKPETDGFVRLFVDSARLEAGLYLVVITPAGEDTTLSATSFRIKVVAAAPPR